MARDSRPRARSGHRVHAYPTRGSATFRAAEDRLRLALSLRPVLQHRGRQSRSGRARPVPVTLRASQSGARVSGRASGRGRPESAPGSPVRLARLYGEDARRAGARLRRPPVRRPLARRGRRARLRRPLGGTSAGRPLAGPPCPGPPERRPPASSHPPGDAPMASTPEGTGHPPLTRNPALRRAVSRSCPDAPTAEVTARTPIAGAVQTASRFDSPWPRDDAG